MRRRSTIRPCTLPSMHSCMAALGVLARVAPSRAETFCRVAIQRLRIKRAILRIAPEHFGNHESWGASTPFRGKQK